MSEDDIASIGALLQELLGLAPELRQAWGARREAGHYAALLFPLLGYFDLISSTDRWIVFDTPQYIRHGWETGTASSTPTRAGSGSWCHSASTATPPPSRTWRSTRICLGAGRSWDS